MTITKWRPLSVIMVVVLLAAGVMVTQAGAVTCDLTPPISEGLACTPSGTTIAYSGSGDVTVTFIDSAAAFDSWIILYSAVPGGGLAAQLAAVVKTDLLSNREAPGTFITFDPSLLGFGAGAELVFALAVDSDNPSGVDRPFDASDVEALWFMGGAGRNSDGIIHADVQSGGPSLAIVGFEDIVGGGDNDHNDHIFSFFPVTIVPNPGGLVLVGMGLIGFALADWKRRRR